MQYDILHISGKPHVLVPLHDYTALKDGRGEGGGNLPEDVRAALALGRDSAIRTLRRYRGMTQEALAAAAGLSRPYLTEIETGRKDGSIRAMKAIAGALEVPLDVLAGG